MYQSSRKVQSLAPAVQHAVVFREDEPRDGVDSSRKTAWRERAPLVDSAVGEDVSVVVLVVHAVCSGARVPSRENRGKVWIVLFDAVHIACLERSWKAFHSKL